MLCYVKKYLLLMRLLFILLKPEGDEMESIRTKQQPNVTTMTSITLLQEENTQSFVSFMMNINNSSQ